MSKSFRDISSKLIVRSFKRQEKSFKLLDSYFDESSKIIWLDFGTVFITKLNKDAYVQDC